MGRFYGGRHCVWRDFGLGEGRGGRVRRSPAAGPCLNSSFGPVSIAALSAYGIVCRDLCMLTSDSQTGPF